MTERASRIAPPGSRALSLGAAWEFVHLHPAYDGSLHVSLPEALEAQVLAGGWGEQHPLKRRAPTAQAPTMVFGPRDAQELEVVVSLVEAAHAHEVARGHTA